MTLEEVKRQAVREYLQAVLAAATSIAEAARMAGCNRTNFYDICDRHDVEPVVLRPKQRPRPWMRRYGPILYRASALRELPPIC